VTENRTPNGFVVTSMRMLDCPHCRGKESLRIEYDANGCARLGYCRRCGGQGPFTPCQECKKDPKPCQPNVTPDRTATR
jgi:hypothetical protein